MNSNLQDLLLAEPNSAEGYQLSCIELNLLNSCDISIKKYLSEVFVRLISESPPNKLILLIVQKYILNHSEEEDLSVKVIHSL